MLTVAQLNMPIPDDLHRRAKAAAALGGVSLKDFVETALLAAVEASEKKGRR